MTSAPKPAVLSAESILFMIEDGRAKIAAQQINTLPDNASKTKILAADNVVSELTAHGQIKTVLDILKAVSLQERALILKAPKAVFGLTEREHAQTAIIMIRALPNDTDKMEVLMAKHAIFGLTSCKQTAAVMSIIEGLPSNLQKLILADEGILHSLKVYKQDAAIERIEASWRSEVTQRLRKDAAAPKPKS